MRGLPLCLLAGAVLVRSITAQSCSASFECATCAATSGCGWCAGSVGSYCVSASSCLSPQTCPAASTAAWSRAGPLGVLAVGVVAIAVLAFFTFSSAEDSLGAQVLTPLQSADVLLVFSAASALWLGASLALAAPAVPWLVHASDFNSVGFTFSTYYECQRISASAQQFCQTMSSFEYLSVVSAANLFTGNDEAIAQQYVNSGVALGSLMYIAIISCLVPAAAMTSLAAYRLKRFASLGIPPYFGGFPATSLFIAQTLAWVGFAVVSITWWSALGVCNSVSSKYSTAISGRGTTLSYASMPGPVLSGLAFAFLLVGSALTSHAANRLHGVLGVGCTARCCRSAHAEQQRHWQQAAPQDAPPPPQQHLQQSYGAPQQMSYQQSSYQQSSYQQMSSDPRTSLLSLAPAAPPQPQAPPRFMVPYKT